MGISIPRKVAFILEQGPGTHTVNHCHAESILRNISVFEFVIITQDLR